MLFGDLLAMGLPFCQCVSSGPQTEVSSHPFDTKGGGALKPLWGAPPDSTLALPDTQLNAGQGPTDPPHHTNLLVLLMGTWVLL